MKVVVHKPVPLPVPPTTYDLLGLTADELRLIRHMIASASVNNERNAGIKIPYGATGVGGDLFRKLCEVVL